MQNELNVEGETLLKKFAGVAEIRSTGRYCVLNGPCAHQILDKYQAIQSFLIHEKEYDSHEIERTCCLSQNLIPKVLLRGSVGELQEVKQIAI